MTQPRLLGDRYELDGVVGRGGMAEVYRARDIRLDRVVAIKTLRADLARDQTFQARFRREAQSAASLNNPSIVAVYDTGEDQSTGVPVPYIVMEYVDGRTVRDLLIEGHRLLPERALEIISGVLRALEYSHQAGIVHRDIKPGNVMVTRAGDVKVMDFGIARAMSDAQATMTQTAQVIGTAQYLSPEQARGERVDARSDIYSTGCLMYELLTGRPPFTGDSPVAIAYQHVRENPIPPSRLDPDMPPWADAIVLKAMAKSPNERYQTAADMGADIQRAASGMQTAASMAPPTRADYYDYPHTQRMGPQTMMGAAPTSVSSYQQGGYQPATYPGQYPDGGGYGGGDTERRGGARRWLPWLISALVVVAAIAVAAIMLTSNNGTNVGIPSVAGQTWTQAEGTIKAAGLNPKEVQQANPNVQSGHVIGTNPPEGNMVPKGSTVSVYVSTGAAKANLPDVTHLQQADATSKLNAAGFKNISVVPDPQSTLPQGEVDRMSPAPNNAYTPDTQITLYVSGGGIQVPQVTGLPVASAVAELKSYGFTSPPNISYVAGPVGENIPPGTVWQQVPGQGKVATPDTVISLLVQPQATATPSASTTPSGTPTDTGSPTPTGSGTPTPTGSTTTGPTGGITGIPPATKR